MTSIEEMRRELKERFETLKDGVIKAEEMENCHDILKKLRDTNQIYIIDHDVPLSISKHLFYLLDAKRREEARKRGIPEGQFEFEDIIGLFLGL